MSQGALKLTTVSPLPGATAVAAINTALAAIVSLSSATSAPTLGPGAASALVKGQEWLDTTTAGGNLRKIYDGTSWVSWMSLDTTNHLVAKFFLGTGGIIDFGSGNATLAHASNQLSLTASGAPGSFAISNTNLILNGSAQPNFYFSPTSGNTRTTQMYQAADVFGFIAPGFITIYHIDLTTGQIVMDQSIASTSTTTGTLVNPGGFGLGGAAYIGGSLNVMNGGGSQGVQIAYDAGNTRFNVDGNGNTFGLTLRAINGSGDIWFATGGSTVNTKILSTGAISALLATSIPAGGTADIGIMLSSTAHFGIFFGSGAPSLSAAKGSLYLRSDGSGIADRAYINTNGSTTWTAIATAA